MVPLPLPVTPAVILSHAALLTAVHAQPAGAVTATGPLPPVASGAALELQHRAPLVIERINLFFGRQVIMRLALVQGPLPLASPPTGPILRPLGPGEVKALHERLSEITDPELRDALARLGRAVIGGDR